MIIIYGDSPVVSLVKWNGHPVWTTGLKTPKNVIQTYMSQCIMVVKKIEDLMWDMTTSILSTKAMQMFVKKLYYGAYCLNYKMV